MSKRHVENRKLVEKLVAYPLEEAVQILKSCSGVKFDESVDLAVNLSIDVTKSDQLVRGSFSFPHGIGKSVRVIAIVSEGDVDAAKEAGATEAGGADLIKRIEEGWLDFDVVISHPSMMKDVGKLGRFLGPRGLMPSPKSGTITSDIAKAVQEFSSGKIEFRNDKLGNIQVPVGKISFDVQKIVDNVSSFCDFIISRKPNGVKGIFVKSIYLSSTMGPGIKIENVA